MALTKATYSMIQGAVINVLDYGADPTGVADSTAALQTAMNLTGRMVYLPTGTYKVSATLVPSCAAIVGEGELASIIKPTAAVTTVLSIGTNGPRNLADFGLDGVNTSNATGILLGSSITAVNAQSIYVQRFTGTNAVGIRVGDLLKSTLTKLTAYQCGTGFLVQMVTSALPTTVHLDSCTASASSVYGERVLTGGSILHTNCIFESSSQEGVRIDPTVGDTTEIGYVSCWFESNNGNSNTKYHAVVNTTTRTARAFFSECYFDTNSGGTAAKAIQFTGTGVRSNLNAPTFASSYAGAVSVESSAVLEIGSWNPSFTYSCVINSGGVLTWPEYTVSGLTSAWTSYTPTYASNLGNAAFTFSGAVTTSLAQYKQMGKTLFLNLTWNGTLNAIAPGTLWVSLPSGMLCNNNTTYSPAVVINGAATSGIVRTDGGSNLYFAPAVGSFTAGAAVGGYVSVVIELQ